MIHYHKFLSENHPNTILTIGEKDDGTYFIPAAAEMVDPKDNVFQTIEQIEQVLEDKLTLIVPKTDVN